jgi:hypothetical protein
MSDCLAHLPLRPERGTSTPRVSQELIERTKVVEKDRISLKSPNESTFHLDPKSRSVKQASQATG